MSLGWMLVTWSQWSRRSSVGLTTAFCLAFTSSFSPSFAVCVTVLLSLDACGCCEVCWPWAPGACPLTQNNPDTSSWVSSMRLMFARNTVGRWCFGGGEDPWVFSPAGRQWVGKGHQQERSAVTCYSPRFPGAGGHVGGRKQVQEWACAGPPSTRYRKACKQWFLQRCSLIWCI